MQYLQESISQFKEERSLVHAMAVAANEPNFSLYKHRHYLRHKGILVFLARKDFKRVGSIINVLKSKHMV